MSGMKVLRWMRRRRKYQHAKKWCSGSRHLSYFRLREEKWQDGRGGIPVIEDAKKRVKTARESPTTCKVNSQERDFGTLEINSQGEDPRTLKDPVERWRVQEKRKEKWKKRKKKKVKYRKR